MHIKQKQIVKDLNDLDVLEEQGDLDEARFNKQTPTSRGFLENEKIQ